MGEAVNKVSETVQSSDGVKDDKISHVNLYQGDKTDNAMNGYAAAYDQNSNETYLNTEGTDISKGGDIITSLFWEAQRKDNTTNGLDLDAGQQLILASSRGEQAGNLWNRFSETASTTTNHDAVINWNTVNAGSDTLIKGSAKANELNTDDGHGVVPRPITPVDVNNARNIAIMESPKKALTLLTAIKLEGKEGTTEEKENMMNKIVTHPKAEELLMELLNNGETKGVDTIYETISSTFDKGKPDFGSFTIQNVDTYDYLVTNRNEALEVVNSIFGPDYNTAARLYPNEKYDRYGGIHIEAVKIENNSTQVQIDIDQYPPQDIINLPAHYWYDVLQKGSKEK